MIKYRFYNKTAVSEGYPKEEYSSEWFSTYNAALKFMIYTQSYDVTLGISDEYEIEEKEFPISK